MIRSATHSVLMSLACAAFIHSSVAFGQESSVIIAPRIVAPDGQIVRNQAIAIEDGRIVSVADQEQVSAGDAQLTLIEHEGAVVCPGFIALLTDLGIGGGAAAESTNVVDPSINAIDAFDASDENLTTALQGGVTSALIAPAPSNLINGVGAVVRTHGSDHLRTDGPLVLALGDSMLSAARNPSSRSGALFLLREVMETATSDEAHPRVRALATGTLDSIAYCDTPQDVSALLRLLSHHDATPAIVHSGRSAEIAGEVAAVQAPVVIGPLTPQTPLRELHAAGTLADAGVTVAFRAGSGPAAAHTLQVSAALAVRYGMDPAAARRALTVNAANIAGVDERVGALAPGLDADFVVFSDDPLRPDARVLEVWIRGQRVYARAPQAEPWSSQP